MEAAVCPDALIRSDGGELNVYYCNLLVDSGTVSREDMADNLRVKRIHLGTATTGTD